MTGPRPGPPTRPLLGVPPMARPAADLTRQTFGRLRPLRRVGVDAKGNALWVCLCDPALGGCGQETGPVRACNLTGGGTESCGCLRGQHARTPEFLAAQAARGRLAIRKTLATAGWRRLHRHVHPRVCARLWCRQPFRGTARQRYCCVGHQPGRRRRRARCFRRPPHRRRAMR
jgi:hypothetical protein